MSIRPPYRRDEPTSLPVLVVLLGICVGLSACEPDASPASRDTAPRARPVGADSMTLPQMLTTDDRFSTLRAALDSTDLDSVAATEGPFTLFAPPNEAFAAVSIGPGEEGLAENQDRLRALLGRHIVKGRVAVTGRSEARSVVTIGGDTLSLHPVPNGDTVRIEGTPILDGDIEAGNGFLHVVDAVLRAPTSDAP